MPMRQLFQGDTQNSYLLICICPDNFNMCRHADPLGSDSDDEDAEPPLTPHGDHTSAPSSRPSKHASCNRPSLGVTCGM